MEEMAEVPMKRLHTALFFPYIVGLEKFFEHFHCELRLFFFAQKVSIIVPSLDLMPLREGPSIHFLLNHQFQEKWVNDRIRSFLVWWEVASRGVSQ